MIFQPSDERRRSGSHYTPRSLTEPIVRTTLEPILKQLCDPESPAPIPYSPTKEDKKRYTQGELDARIRLSERAIENARRAREVGRPHPSQLLDLKVCDPAMGSGAFLVETCRQLGDELVKAWYAHYKDNSGSEGFPDIPPDEDELLYARRQIAQRCLYGVDKNVMAVDLAKLSLWLVTLAKDHAFTFLDHSLRAGDSLVGLTREQIISFHWEPKKQKKFGEDLIQKRLDKATSARAKILNAREDVAYRDQQQEMKVADDSLDLIRLVGNACVSCFFAADKTKAREEELERVFDLASSYISSLPDNYPKLRAPIDFQSRAGLQTAAERLKAGPHPVPCFHWEIEFPEVFSRENGGFDAFVGNPPYAGRTTLSNSNADGYIDWLKELHVGSHGNSDLVAHFFRRVFFLMRKRGTAGLVSTNTVAQGDSRTTGLQWMLERDGTIYNAQRRRKWPGQAAVVISVIHFTKGHGPAVRLLNEVEVPRITAFLFHAGGNTTPPPLHANENKSFQGCVIIGIGFTFDDTDEEGLATPIAEMHQLVAKNSKNEQCIFPCIGGQEVNENPSHLPHRFIIHFGNRTLDEAREWPDLIKILETKVKPDREAKAKKSPSKDKEKRAQYWWQFSRNAHDLYEAIENLDRVLVCSIVSNKLAFTFLPKKIVYTNKLMVFALSKFAHFALLQSSVHDAWVRLLTSTMKDDLNYSNTDCFENFPFPCDSSTGLEQVGKDCFELRAKLMVQNNEGLTKTYNRFHDPNEKSSEILQLRELHAAMDRAVLEAYGWDDLAATARCEFLLDYE
ncbi:MAG: type IIL restriction-modification enzyme MmeI, partial [Pirellula sp.]